LFGASGHAEKGIANDPRVPKDRVGRITVAHGAEPVLVRLSRRPTSHGITEHAVPIYGGRMASVPHPRVRPRGRTPVHDVRSTTAVFGKHATVTSSGPLLFHWVKVRRVGATISVIAAPVVTQAISLQSANAVVIVQNLRGCRFLVNSRTTGPWWAEPESNTIIRFNSNIKFIIIFNAPSSELIYCSRDL